MSLDGATADVVRTVALRLPEGATVQQTAVTVRVTIVPAQATLPFTVAVTTTNVPTGLTATLAPATVQVILGGALPDLGRVTVEEISVTLDLQSLTEGEHDVPVRVQAPAGTRVVSFAPSTVHVTVRRP